MKILRQLRCWPSSNVTMHWKKPDHQWSDQKRQRAWTKQLQLVTWKCLGVTKKFLQYLRVRCFMYLNHVLRSSYLRIVMFRLCHRPCHSRKDIFFSPFGHLHDFPHTPDYVPNLPVLSSAGTSVLTLKKKKSIHLQSSITICCALCRT